MGKEIGLIIAAVLTLGIVIFCFTACASLKSSGKVQKDTWTAEKKLSDIPAEPLTVSAADAQPVKVTLDISEKTNDGWSFQEGGMTVKTAEAVISGSAPDAVQKIFNEYNENLFTERDAQIEEGFNKWTEYQKKNRESKFISLNTDIGIHIERADTSIVSFVLDKYYFYRDIDPSIYEIHGRTYDAATGRELSLNDVLTDTSILPDLICEELENNSSYREGKYSEEGFKKRIGESIEGCRDDGHFAWAIGNYGIEFWFSTPFYQNEYIMKQHVTVPFESLSGVLNEGFGRPDYDSVSPITNSNVLKVFGAQAPLSESKEAYAVIKSGKDYLYKSDGEETVIFEFKDGAFSEIGRVLGTVYEQYYVTAGKLTDPDNMELRCGVTLIRELSVSGKAMVGDDGIPVVANGLYEVNRGVEPVSLITDLEALVFDDGNDTEGHEKTVPAYTDLDFTRTDGKSFVDFETVEGQFVRLYIEGSEESGWYVNGKDIDEVLSLSVYIEE